MTIFSKPSYNSLKDVYTTYLSNPLSDDKAPRGPYIDKWGAYRQYSKEQQVKKDPHEVYRPNHGLAHNVRVTSKVRDVIALYADPNANTNAESRQWFEQLNNSDEITKLEIVGSFYVACRESEVGFSPESGSPYQRYREASSNAFYHYAKGLGLFTEEELELYKSVLRDPYFDKSTDGSTLLAQDKSLAKKAAVKAVLSSCHALDLARCFHVEKMNNKIIEVLDPLGNWPNDYSRNKVAENFVRSEIQHILTGNKCNCTFDPRSHSFQDIAIPGKNHLFRMAGTNPDIAMRLVSLSSHVTTVDQAKQLALSLNRYAMKNAQALTEFLSDVEQCFSDNPTKMIDTLLEEEKLIIKNTSTGRIFKTIRNDDGDFWDEFAKSLIDIAGYRPELRKGSREKFTIRLNNGTYEIVSTIKRERNSLHGKKKLEHTKHQSTSYSNYEAGYNLAW